MDIVVYSKKSCPHCLSAKVWLEQRQYQFTEISLDDPKELKAFQESYPNLTTVPQIFVDGKNIGGFSELIRSDL